MIVFFHTYAVLDKIDLTQMKIDLKDLNITDKWLIKLTDDFIEKATSYMESYNSKDVCTLFESYIDNVSNFYIRINRRRFWKSENTTDKLAAYQTLFYSILNTTKIMAPIIPFFRIYMAKCFKGI